ncbi:hypothetical protein AA313_de0200676 [Arthrobotrys entomopaga]|nr:hypothetical protein AA313_de0200676 [Arthrobotrys entomopaga]
MNTTISSISSGILYQCPRFAYCRQVTFIPKIRRASLTRSPVLSDTLSSNSPCPMKTGMLRQAGVIEGSSGWRSMFSLMKFTARVERLTFPFGCCFSFFTESSFSTPNISSGPTSSSSP